MAKIRKQDALDYHSSGRPGKIEVVPTKPYASQRDLSLAYSPGVAEPCLRIAENPDDVYKYTSKSNLVAVISNGTAVLGLGNIGPLASKPVMEGKGLLFKIFADIDVFDIEVDASDPELFIQTVKAIAPTFGGINLEDIKAPEAFEIERRLKEELDIPIMHDDQHGTAIISSAALINALELARKKIDKVKIVVSGAGAAAMSCVKLYRALGAQVENIWMFDSRGLIWQGREDLDESKVIYSSHKKDMLLAEAMKKADVFVGLSKGDIVSKDMVASMAKDPIVFALANPDPEITYKDATSVRKDIIMATGRSDHPNQVNNVLGFPYIFRGALDVRATTINEEMKLAAVKALASLAKETIPEEVIEAYGEKNISFGREQIIPKPLDPRLIYYIAPAVAKAAMESGVAKNPIADWDLYEMELKSRLGLDNKLIRNITEKAQMNPKRVVFAEADNIKILKAAQTAWEEGVAFPILLGKRSKIEKLIAEYNIEFPDVEIIDPKSEEEEERRILFGKGFFEKRKRKGFTEFESIQIMRERNHFGAMMVETGAADAMISGITRNYRDVVRPAIQTIGLQKDVKTIAGMYILNTKRGPLFLADTTINLDPTAEQIAEITVNVAKTIRKFKVTPKIALLSYSNFGSSPGPDSEKMAKAVDILHENYPSLVVDGELQANFALNNELMMEKFSFSQLANKQVNTLIFPNLSSGNIAYKLLQQMTEGDAIGPVLVGLKKSVHVMQMGSSVREIVNMVKIAVVDAQNK
ncbi:MAG: NADP-dependent malic enzyme [Crocinitomicaceae bacterium]|jgi:malate dehydrogenase (oxaloacetate-decarboxylating)(NADP+)|nr:NADP-dependent malic enzyme [Crocinitomicaceae bacterium]MDP4866494.1 NADP-dependent malic enzyme [Crocinitomicaceae bacterium]MDP5011513.1 NADP-dependent malic enzyme [Crocinitomicaceae bacterium]